MTLMIKIYCCFNKYRKDKLNYNNISNSNSNTKKRMDKETPNDTPFELAKEIRNADDPK